jgi:hypothetical protein
MLEVVNSTATIINPEVTTAVSGLFTLAFQTILLLLVAGITWGVRLGLQTIKNSLIRSFVRRAVAWAQQRLVGNEEKQKWVAAQIHKKFPRLDREDVETFIEEAVLNLKKGLSAGN